MTDVGLKTAVAPAGRPLTENTTTCVLPDVSAVEIVVVLAPPGITGTAGGLAAREKSFGAGAVTVRVTAIECVTELPAPVTTIV